MSEESQSKLRRRRSSGNPNLALNLEVGTQVNEGEVCKGTPSPGVIRFMPNSADAHASPSSSSLLEFRKKQQSFDIQIEECEEEEIVVDSEDEGGDEAPMVVADRAVTPTPIQDFAANTVYTEGPKNMEFLQVRAVDTDCVTDVSDAESENEE